MPPLLPALLLAAASPAAVASAVHVQAAWSRPAAAGAVGVGYAILVNDGARPATLTAARSPAARRMSLHASTMSDGVMHMAAAPALTVPPHGRVELKPGGYHFMLMGLKAALKPGDRVPAVLTVDGRPLRVEFQVRHDLPR